MLNMSSVEPTSNTTKRDEWTLLYCETMEDVQEAVDSIFISTQIKIACEEMLSNDTTAHMCTEIFCIDTLSTIWVSITLEDAPSILEVILTKRQDAEEYEECIALQALLDEVKDRLLSIKIRGLVSGKKS